MVTLQDAVGLISSEKATERALGIEQYRQIFSDDRTLERIGRGEEAEKRWLRTMQALFSCVISDRTACIRRGSWRSAAAASKKRLQDSAAMVLWMIERAHTMFGRKPLVSAINHLSQTLDFRGELVEPIATAYLKALHVLLSYPPHIDHLDEDLWRSTTSLCFNIILDDTLSDEPTFNEALQSASLPSQETRTKSPMTRPEHLEAARCIHALVRGSHAPLIGLGQIASVTVFRIARILRTFPLATSIHLPILTALNEVLTAMRVNETEALLTFAELAWQQLISLWSAKAHALKEQAILALRTLVPAVAKAGMFQNLGKLNNEILGEASDRLSLQPLSLAHVELGWNDELQPFQYLEIRASPRIGLANLLAWSTLELGADVVAWMHVHANQDRGEPDQLSDWVSPSKRRKVGDKAVPVEGDDTLSHILDFIKQANVAQSARLWRIQLLLFLVLRHFDRLPASSQASVLHALSDKLPQEDQAVQSWSFVALASAASYPTFANVAHHVWQTACRHMVRSSTCRCASHVGQVILGTSHLSKAEMSNSLAGFFGDLDMQGPTTLSDGVCAFITNALAFVIGDVELSQRGFHEKVFVWLRETWTPSHALLIGPRSRLLFDEVTSIDVARLVLTICRLRPSQPLAKPTICLPASATTAWAQSKEATYDIERFTLNAELNTKGSNICEKGAALGQMTTVTLHGQSAQLESRCIAMISKVIESASSALAEAVTDSTTITETLFNDLVGLVNVSLYFQAGLRERDSGLLQSANRTTARLLYEIIITLTKYSLRPAQKAGILQPLQDCLTYTYQSGGKSGDRQNPLKPPPKDLTSKSGGCRNAASALHTSSTSTTMAKLSPPMHDLFNNGGAQSVVAALEGLFDDTAGFHESNQAEKSLDMDDVWTGQASGFVHNESPRSGRNSEEAVLLSTCISLLLPVSSSCGESGRAAEKLSIWLANAPSELFLAVAPSFLRCSDHVQYVLDEQSFDLWMERIGTDILATYGLERETTGHLLAIQLLQTTQSAWLAAFKSTPHLFDRSVQICEFFMRQFDKAHLHGTVEIAFADLMEGILPTLVSSKELQAALPRSLRPPAVVKSLCVLSNRPDMRTRYPSSSLVGRLFEVWVKHIGDPEELFQHILDHGLPIQKEERSRMASRILTLANISVASAQVQRFALFHLLEVCISVKGNTDLAGATLEAVASTLHFPRTQDLWLAFAGQLIPALISADYGLEQIPFGVFGYESRKDWADDSFPLAAPTLLSAGNDAYKRAYQMLCNYSIKAESVGAMECLPTLIAQKTGVISVQLASSEVRTNVNQWVLDLLGSSSTNVNLAEVQLQERLDTIVTELLLQWYEADTEAMTVKLFCSNAIFSDALSKLENHKIQQTPEPHCDTTQVLAALTALSRPKRNTTSAEVIFNVLHRLGSTVFGEHLVHDQIRHLHAMYVYVSSTWSTIAATPVVLRVLMHICSVLVRKQELVTIVTPLVEACLKSVNVDIPQHSALLVGMAGTACDLSNSPSDEIEQSGRNLLACLEAALEEMFETDTLRTCVLNALCAWPRNVPRSLIDICSEINLEDLSKSLQAVKVINKPFLDRCLRALQRANALHVGRFAASSIWTLIEVLKTESKLRDGAVITASGIADIVFHCHGQLRTPSVKLLQHSTDISGLLHCVREIDPKGSTPTLPLRQWITQQLLDETHSYDLSEAQSAIRTLRAIFAQEPHFAGPKLQLRSSDAINELRLVNAFVTSPSKQRKRHRDELTSPAARERPANFGSWACWLAELLCELMSTRDSSQPYASLAPLLRNRPHIASKLLSAIVHVFYRTGLCEDVEAQKDSKALSCHLLDALRNDHADEQTWHKIILVVQQLREDSPSDTPFSGDKWIDGIDFMLLSSRCAKIRLHASALLFLELHHQYSPGLTPREYSMSMNLQYAIFSNIDDPDSFYGIKNPNVRDALQRRLTHEGHWQRVFELQAAQLEVTTELGISDMADSLHRQGFNRVALRVGTATSVDYNAAWRTQKWDLPEQTEKPERSQKLYSALRALHQDRNPDIADAALSCGLSSMLDKLRTINVESSRESHEAIQDLLGLNEVRKWKDGKTELFTQGQGSNFEFETFERLLSVQLSLLQAQRHRSQRREIGDRDCDETDEGLARESVVLLALSQRAREEGKTQIAINAITQAQHRMLEMEDLTTRHVIDEEFANVLWAQNDHAIAIEAMNGLLTNGLQPSSIAGRKRRAQALARLGRWRATARSHQAHLIVSECFRPAIRLLDGTKANNEMAEVCYRYAVFADDQYRALSASPESRELGKAVSHRQEELRQLDAELAKTVSSGSKNRRDAPLQRAKMRSNAILQLDLATLAEHNKAKDQFRREAAEMFARELVLSDRHNDDALMRMTALWFENARNQGFNEHLNVHLKRIPSWKFLPLARQICSRLTKEMPGQSQTGTAGTAKSASAAFQHGVYETVLRITSDHPFHAMYPLYALARGNKDNLAPQLRARGPRTGSPTAGIASSQAGRGDAASEIIDLVRTRSAQKERIQTWQIVCDACVEWAQVDLSKAMPKEFGPKAPENKKTGPARIPLHLSIHKVRDVDVPVITAPLPVDPTGRYAEYVSIARYADRFTTAGGVHLPKITDCIGSDGKVYRQLFKDMDDLRQDAVMQQVFNLVNTLLKLDRRARRRSLHVRTYAVVPLGPRYGLLEYVGNTVPLLSPLRSVYERHHVKGQLKPAEARQRIYNCQNKTAEEKRANFADICAKMPPKFRFYFLHQYTIPMALLASRLNYTRSVATTSIVGHVLGLGDRHASNILLDQQTGEVVHIDFGVAFDQGRLLPIPELVPFRLTRNMVDGMGLNGVEGVYRCSCQETLRVLRAGASVIKTVLEVFRFDPLYDWTQNPIKVIQAQGYDNGGRRRSQEMGVNVVNMDGTTVAPMTSHLVVANAVPLRLPGGVPEPAAGGNGGHAKEVAELLAERAINSVMEKLSTNLSVEYTVNDLMTKAMDHTNLGSIFHGWQAAL